MGENHPSLCTRLQLGNSLEPPICPSLGILNLHEVTHAFRQVRRAAMPALMIGQIDVAGFAEDRLWALAFKQEAFCWFAARIMALGHKLGWPMFNLINITQGYLYRHPKHGHTNPRIETGNLWREGKFQYIIDMPAGNSLALPIADHVHGVKFCILAQDRLRHLQNGRMGRHRLEGLVAAARAASAAPHAEWAAP